MLQGAVMAPCTMCTWDEYSGKSSCTRLWHASIVGVPWHRDMKNRFPHRSPRFGLRGCSPGPRRFLGKAETGIKWKLNVFVSRAHIIIRGTISVWTGIRIPFRFVFVSVKFLRRKTSWIWFSITWCLNVLSKNNLINIIIISFRNFILRNSLFYHSILKFNKKVIK